MAKTLGNLPYNEIQKDRINTVKREGITKDEFKILNGKMNVCGFENKDELITIYFFKKDLELFESILNKTDDKLIFKKIEDLNVKIEKFENLLLKVQESIDKSNNNKATEDRFIFLNKKLEGIEEGFASAFEIIGEVIKDRNSTNPEVEDQKQEEVSIIESNGCSIRLSELTDKFDILYGDIIRNIAYLRKDMKKEIGRKAILNRKRLVFIVVIFAIISIGICFKKFLWGWLF